MLDDLDYIAQTDPDNALAVVAGMPEHLRHSFEPSNIEVTEISNVIIAGMGGSGLAGLLFKTWAASSASVPIELIRQYTLPKYINQQSLVIISSYSGNTEETIACIQEALQRNAQVVCIAAGGKLSEIAAKHKLVFFQLPEGYQPRMALFYGFRALYELFLNYNLVKTEINFDTLADFGNTAIRSWLLQVVTRENYTKQLAEKLMGKTPVVYAGPTLAPAAYKWKIGFNENSKNLAFWNELPEFNHNEFLGWTSHPVEKPFAVVELQSDLDQSQVQKRFQTTNKLLSGQMPAPIEVKVQGSTQLEQLVWAILLGDFVSVYLGILNGVNPTRVDLIEKLKQGLK